jgi:hypothetical protein
VDIPEWEVYALVRPIGPKERDALEAWIVSSMEGREFTSRNFRGWVAALVITDEEGERIFADGDAEYLGTRSTEVLDRIVSAALELSGIVPETLDLGEPKDSTERFMFKMLRGNPTFRFKTHYKRHYRPDHWLDRLLAAIPSVPDKERADALARLLRRHPNPIYYKRWQNISWYVMRGLAEDAKSQGKSVEEEKKERLLDSLKAAIVTARRKTGIFATEEEWSRKFKSSYRKEAETDLRIPKRTDAFSYLETERPPEDPEEVEEPNLTDDVDPNHHRAELDLVERLELLRRFERHSPPKIRRRSESYSRTERISSGGEVVEYPRGNVAEAGIPNET